MSKHTPFGVNFYSLLGLHPQASNQEIRRAYRELSKRYHPDTTDMPEAIAKAKFQQINEAYATLVNSEKRLEYDQKIRRLYIDDLSQRVNFYHRNSSSYLDPQDRPLSAGELFALLIIGVTLICCLLIAITIGLIRPELTIQPIQPPGNQFIEIQHSL
ncbi:MAG: J domain-containing protein [Okeania sp. SIO3H1]|uniref:J domain-containing protein n=1 Tax=Okeania sp. SIO1I7 TaxID=2607772 RepID=UPI0013C9AF18|nr:J domain-containing protein [Okeania sp. SIO1I7]NEN93063.1 J domain-containing protein [Okeania sp. SIO3H1]NET26962.1 J domain-containing protein [Okeania sp. SIO1I7]